MSHAVRSVASLPHEAAPSQATFGKPVGKVSEHAIGDNSRRERALGEKWLDLSRDANHTLAPAAGDAQAA
ncbi:hypothetical protein G7Z17_g13123 [Cylindrodendrum hubeiense]|uniref:Uncharacterized protein n=1 Tax=Cylindrodendrum hubeiense TaxID=595255 RepID=A0A9P5GZJ5_9HYPO|nr:hypothetical protein G7Z17_g13123 [Cylindrodendrum hubeiense]